MQHKMCMSCGLLILEVCLCNESLRDLDFTVEVSFIGEKKRIGGVIVCVISSSVIDRGFYPWSGQQKTMKLVVASSTQSPHLME